jgi:hypothetical protein
MDSSFFKVLNSDLSQYRPKTTQEEKVILMSKALTLFSTYNSSIKFINKIKIQSLDELQMNFTNKKIFMYRKLHSETEIPHKIPEDYIIFEQSSGDIYDNFVSTIDNLAGTGFNDNDVNKLVTILSDSQKTVGNTSVLSWSNSGIILSKALEKLNKDIKKNLIITTFASPKLVSENDVSYCLNIYHEDDWILELFETLYRINTKEIERDIINECYENKQKCFFIILSRDYFKNNNFTPHRCFNLFL